MITNTPTTPRSNAAPRPKAGAAVSLPPFRAAAPADTPDLAQIGDHLIVFPAWINDPKAIFDHISPDAVFRATRSRLRMKLCQLASHYLKKGWSKEKLEAHLESYYYTLKLGRPKDKLETRAAKLRASLTQEQRTQLASLLLAEDE